MSVAVPEIPVQPATAPEAAPAPKRRRRLRNVGLALLGYGYVVGIALLTMVLGGLVLHALVPSREIDIFAALHNQVAVAILLGLSVLWLLPPYPWAQEHKAVAQEPASAGETESEGAPGVISLADYRGRDPSHRPRAQQGGADSR